MKIIINYESSWRNSFLDGDNNNPLPKKGRKFVGSMTNLKNPDNYIKREITINTVMGVLNRLIGDQRKLYQARESHNYFFKDIDFTNTDKVKFLDNPIETNEVSYIRNITGSDDQNSYTGAIKTSDPIFSSDYSNEFWGVLELNLESVCQFIISNNEISTFIEANPLSIIEKLKSLNKLKPVANEGLVTEAVKILNQHFPDTDYLNKKGLVIPIRLYCSTLYLQLHRLSEKEFDMTSAKTKAGGISGISKRTFTTKDFMNRFTTGNKKRIWGNPYIRKEKTKGIGETISLMTKASGRLEINLKISRDKAETLKSMFENAGVSSFYLGKKGLAYVSSINTREI
jgi:hypothetical protein